MRERDIPQTLMDAIDLDPSSFVDALRELPKLTTYWTAELAAAEEANSRAKLAKEIGLESLKLDARLFYQTNKIKATEAMVGERAKTRPEYRELCNTEIATKKEAVRIKGVVNAILTKRKALRTLTYLLKPSMDIASESFVLSDEQIIGSSLEGVLQRFSDEVSEKRRLG